MSYSTVLAQQISLFRSQVQNRSFDDVAVRILEWIMASKDVESLIGVGSTLKQFMRNECLLIFREIAENSIEIKLFCTDFLIRVFAIIGDVESCLALRYEALVMREQNAATDSGLQVTTKEWLTLIEHLFENGFHSLANQACEKALVFSVTTPKIDDCFNDVCAVKQIKKLKDAALMAISSQSVLADVDSDVFCGESVEAQAAAYLKQKKVVPQPCLTTSTEQARSSGSSMFRNGIRKHNLRKLHYHRCLQQSS